MDGLEWKIPWTYPFLAITHHSLYINHIDHILTIFFRHINHHSWSIWLVNMWSIWWLIYGHQMMGNWWFPGEKIHRYSTPQFLKGPCLPRWRAPGTGSPRRPRSPAARWPTSGARTSKVGAKKAPMEPPGNPGKMLGKRGVDTDFMWINMD